MFDGMEGSLEINKAILASHPVQLNKTENSGITNSS